MNATAPRLFRPGDGTSPPALTGRTEQQRVLSRCLADLVARSAPPHNVVLLGPRGNGKTALLNWFRAACKDRKVDAMALTPQRFSSHEELVDLLAPPRILARWLPRKIGVAGLGSAEWQARGRHRTDLTQALTARAGRKPLAVLLDEAHTLDLQIGAALLNASQQVRAEAPLLLVLAGTPGLPDRLSAMDASFWSRLGEGLLPVGRLDETAARKALTQPLAAHRIGIEPDALASVVAHSQRYPYFIQLWGDALWQGHVASGTPITSETVAAARPSVAASVADYYQTRYRELRTEGLLAAAVAVAPLFQADADTTVGEQALEAALATASIDDPAERFRTIAQLSRLGYVWCPPGQVPPIAWSAGIPSLTTYVLAQRPEAG